MSTESGCSSGSSSSNVVSLTDDCYSDLQQMRGLLSHQLSLVDRCIVAMAMLRSKVANRDISEAEAAEAMRELQRSQYVADSNMMTRTRRYPLSSDLCNPLIYPHSWSLRSAMATRTAAGSAGPSPPPPHAQPPPHVPPPQPRPMHVPPHQPSTHMPAAAMNLPVHVAPVGAPMLPQAAVPMNPMMDHRQHFLLVQPPYLQGGGYGNLDVDRTQPRSWPATALPTHCAPPPAVPSAPGTASTQPMYGMPTNGSTPPAVPSAPAGPASTQPGFPPQI